MNFIAKMFGGSYDDLWKAVIRPPRDEYLDSDLGPDKFNLKGRNYKRTDFTLVNNRNLKLCCSYWEPYDEEREFERLPCVVYLHGNSSSRAEAVVEAKILLPMNVTLLAFDFAACGRSEGEYISLGWFEREDVECVIEHLRKSNKVSTIGLWGRSMGAVTAIMYGDRDPSIAGMVLDSPFSSLKKLVEELVKDKVNLPSFIVNQALNLVKSSVHKKGKFKLEDIEPIKYAERCFIPCLFVAAKDDNFVKPHHSKILHDSYPGDKNLIQIEGDHNSSRPRFFKDSAAIFFYNTLQVQYLKEISDNYAGFTFNVKKDEPEASEEKVGNVVNDDNKMSSILDNILFNNEKIENMDGINKNSNLNLNENVDKIFFQNNFNFNGVDSISEKMNYINIGDEGEEGEEDEEEMFKKIIELSKKEYEAEQEKGKENNQNDNNPQISIDKNNIINEEDKPNK